MKPAVVRISVETPMRPNFLRMSDGGTVPIEALTDAQLRALAKNWIALLILTARNRRKRKAR